MSRLVALVACWLVVVCDSFASLSSDDKSTLFVSSTWFSVGNTEKEEEWFFSFDTGEDEERMLFSFSAADDKEESLLSFGSEEEEGVIVVISFRKN